MRAVDSRASHLALLTVQAGLILGGATLWLGVVGSAIALWGFGAACLLQMSPSLSLRSRILEGLGNSGLERNRLTLKVVSRLLSLFLEGHALAKASALQATACGGCGSGCG